MNEQSFAYSYMVYDPRAKVEFLPIISHKSDLSLASVEQHLAGMSWKITSEEEYEDNAGLQTSGLKMVFEENYPLKKIIFKFCWNDNLERLRS